MSQVVQYTYDENGKRSWSFVEVPDEVPEDGKEYIRKDKQWVVKTGSSEGLTQAQILARNLGC